MVQFNLEVGQALLGICSNVTETVAVTIVKDSTGEVLATATLTPGLDYFPTSKGIVLNTNMDPVSVAVHIPELSMDEGGNCLYFMPKCI
jgi:hypothetical protein